ncbi:MAG: O-antigen ligase family protein [Candidatus Scalinduaceae bacterium]
MDLRFKKDEIYGSSLFKIVAILSLGCMLGFVTYKLKYIAPFLLLGVFGITLAGIYSEIGIVIFLLIINLSFLQAMNVPYVKLSFIGFFAMWWLYFLGNRLKITRSNQMTFLMVLYISLFILSFLSGGNFFGKIGGGLNYYSNMFFAFVIMTTIRAEEQVRKFLDLLILWGVFLAAIGVIQFVTKRPLFPGAVSEGGLPVTGSTIGDTVFYAVHMQFVIILCFYKLLYKYNNKEKIVPILFVLILLVLGWAFSFNRVTMVSFVVAIFVIAHLHGQKKKALLFLLIALIFIYIFAPRFFSQMYSIITSILYPAGTHWEGRLNLTMAGLKAIKDYPLALLTGFGPGQYVNVIMPYLTPWQKLNLGGTGSMFPVYLLVEIGIFGTALFFWFIWLTLKDLFNVQKLFEQRKRHDMFLITQGLFVAFISLLITSFTGPPHLFFAFWIPIAMVAVLNNLCQKKMANQ